MKGKQISDLSLLMDEVKYQPKDSKGFIDQVESDEILISTFSYGDLGDVGEGATYEEARADLETQRDLIDILRIQEISLDAEIQTKTQDIDNIDPEFLPI